MTEQNTTSAISPEQTTPRKPIVLSGMQPTSRLMLGNYVGALRNWVEMQKTHDCIFLVVDLHALTIRPEPKILRERSLDVAALYIAAGIDPERSVVALQSHIPEHTQLTWILSNFTQMGELSKMTQFKEKSEKHSEHIGLFTYPVLMAADILLYQADEVPVGDDQKQHLELARNIAERFNHLYSPTFTVPEAMIPKVGARIMSLQDPSKKMSKSDDNERATIFLTDSPEEIRSKIKRAVTDSGTDIHFDRTLRPAISNLMTLYQVATGQEIQTVEEHFAGKSYGEFKTELAEAIVEMLRPLRERYTEIRSDKGYLAEILSKGRDEARKRAGKTLRKVNKKVGLVDL